MNTPDPTERLLVPETDKGVDPKDPETAGRGLASVFPGAQDFRIEIPYSASIPIAHGAKQGTAPSLVDV